MTARRNWPSPKSMKGPSDMKTWPSRLDAAEKLSETKPEKETVYFMRGAMYERLKKFDASEAEFRKVLEAGPRQRRRAELSRLYAGRSRRASG